MHGLVFAPRTPRALWVLAFIPALVGVAAIGADTVTQGLELKADLMGAIVDAKGNRPVTINDSHFGKSVALSASAERLHLNALLRMDGGTISFWVKPNWKVNSKESHTLISARWNDSRQSYLAISQGWWEPIGTGRLYFIASNEDIVHCSSPTGLSPHIWSLVTVTWASGSQGFCKLFVDDELRASTERSWSGGEFLEHIELGSDAAATNSRARTAEASIAGLKILLYPVSHREVIQRYKSEEDTRSLYTKKWGWLDQREDNTLATIGAAPNFKQAIFDEDNAWATGPAAIDNILARISAADFNVYVPCIWHGHGALFPSRVTAPDPRFKNAFAGGWDPLEYLVKRAHALNILVYPWFTVVRREDNAHPEWAEAGTPQNAYDVHQPGFRTFAAQLILDVVARYDIDGVNLDYIRAMGVCTSEFCQAEYRERNGKQLLEDYAHAAPDSSAWLRIQDWQDSAVGALVRDIAGGAREIKPALTISIDGFAVSTQAQRPLEGRDEVSWANRGWIDVVFHMDYRPEIDIGAERAARASLVDPGKLWLLVSNYDLIDNKPEPRSGKWLRKVIDFSKSAERDRGLGVYLYGRLTGEQIDALGGGSVKSSAIP